MQAIRRRGQPGFLKTLAGSLAFHLLIAAAGFAVIGEPARDFISPSFTVALVGPGPVSRPAKEAYEPQAPAPIKEKEEVREKKESVEVRQPDIKIKSTEKKQERKAAKESPKDRTAVEEALKRVAEGVDRKASRSLVESKVEALRKKKESEDRLISERLNELKKELGAKERSRPQAQAAGGQGQARSGSAAPKGDAGDYPAYYSAIRDKVQENWIYPEEFGFKDISVVVSIKLSRTGRLMESWIEKSSGNARFDESLIDAIKKAAPFPPLPQDYEGNYFETGFRFCPGCNG